MSFYAALVSLYSRLKRNFVSLAGSAQLFTVKNFKVKSAPEDCKQVNKTTVDAKSKY